MKCEEVNHPKHYQNGLTVEVECNMFKRMLPSGMSDAFKYVWRAGMKDDIEQDIQKALWYLDDMQLNAPMIRMVQENPYIHNLVNFLPNCSELRWKYNILRYILQGDIEMAQSLLYDKLKQLNTAS